MSGGTREGERSPSSNPASGADSVRVPFIYRLIQIVSAWCLRRLAGVHVEGLQNVPASGPCILVANHQSALDPVLLQSSCPRTVYTMTKSTQFASPFFRVFLGWTRTFPTRRYRVDPQSVRILLRLLGEGEAVCLYPEGERSWDGVLQPLRKGAVRVLLHDGVPVIPVGIEGTYDVLPRWASRPRRGYAMYLRFGAPLDLGVHRTRAEREAALPEAEELLRSVLRKLSGEVSREAERVSNGRGLEMTGPSTAARNLLG
ncbi:MAG: 1-acyl-sn-glycerol-3-phosphate acyltransferase [Gemmatimonadetes bacterium]|nr:1-acyl-sn-glycerol-3-phosphate acyltransferase [Gemmatimonadota bacterium]